MCALSCLKVAILSLRRHRKNFMAASILGVDISIRRMSGFDFVTSGVRQTTGEDGAPFRIQSISKRAKAFRIQAGLFLWLLWSRGTGVHRRSCRLVPTGMRRLTGSLERVICPSRSEALILFSRYCCDAHRQDSAQIMDLNSAKRSALRF